MNRASVSAIVACFNAEATIGRALESAKNQSLPIWEIICVDDHSTDQTLGRTEEFCSANPGLSVKIVVNAANQGPSVSRNLAWDMASGDYVAFLDADDVWHPHKIALQYRWMVAHPDVPASGHRYRIVHPDAAPPALAPDEHPSARRISRNRLLLSNPFVTPAVMLKRDLAYRFDPARRYCEDYFLWLQLVCDGLPMMMLDATLVYVHKRIGASGQSRHLWKMRRGDMHNYWTLWRTGKLNPLAMGGLVGYSLLKFLLLLGVGSNTHFDMKQRIDHSGSR